MADVLLGLGSNVGDSRRTLREAIEALDELWTRKAVSSVWRTEPVGYADQDWFLNIAARGETDLSPEELLAGIAAVEEHFGRTRDIPNGPRTLDIDILLYGDLIVDQPGLLIPHPRMHERRFVLAPAAEIAGEVLHPGLDAAVADLVSQLDDASQAFRDAPLAGL